MLTVIAKSRLELRRFSASSMFALSDPFVFQAVSRTTF